MIRWALPLLCLILLTPLVLVDVPPLLDYPNHLARAVVLASAGTDPILSRMYAPHWAIIPNLGIDLVLPALLHVLPVHVAGRILIGVILLLPVLGVVAYSRAVFRSEAAWPLASVLVAYNATFLLGFLNFIAGVGIALLLGAAWIAWRDRYPKEMAIIGSIGTVSLFFCHLAGLLFYFALIGGYELERLWPERGKSIAAAARIRAILPSMVAPLTLYLFSPLAPLSHGIEWTSPIDKARQLILPFANYVLPLDILTVCLIAGFLLACIATRRCRITAAGGITLALTTIGFLAAPWAFKGTYFLDTRFVILLGFLVFAAVLPVHLTRAAASSAAGVFIVLFAIRMGVIGYAWYEHRHDLAELRAVMTPVPPGTRVMTVEVSPATAPGYWQSVPLSRMLSFGLRLDSHMPALLLIEHRAYWPFLFDNPSQQPVDTLPPYKELAEHAGSVAGHLAITAPDAVDLCDYDYLLLLDAGGEPDLRRFASDRLTLVAQRDIAALFRIKQGACLF